MKKKLKKIGRGRRIFLKKIILKNPGKTLEKPRKNPGKNPGKTLGNPPENPAKTPGKPREIPGKNPRKPRENPGKSDESDVTKEVRISIGRVSYQPEYLV